MDCICWPDVIVATLIALLLVLLTYAVIYGMKPKLRIGSATLDTANGPIRIPITNEGRHNVINIQVEACAYDRVNKYTYQFELDHPEFLILPSTRSDDNLKVFKTLGLAESATPYQYSYEQLIAKIKGSEFQLRVRLHGFHEFSGLGKAKERIYNKL